MDLLTYLLFSVTNTVKVGAQYLLYSLEGATESQRHTIEMYTSAATVRHAVTLTFHL